MDNIINNKIGFGRAQFWNYLSLGILWMTDCAQMQTIGIMGPILEKEWKLEPYQKTLYQTIVFVGWSIGSFLGGILSDTYGIQQPLHTHTRTHIHPPLSALVGPSLRPSATLPCRCAILPPLPPKNCKPSPLH